MALTTEEQEFYDFARDSLPKFLFAKERSEEEINAFLKIFDKGRQQIVAYFTETLIGQASGVWLDQHAKDRGTDRQDGETDAALRARLVNIEDAITRQAILDAAQAVIDGESISGTVALLELRRDKGWIGVYDDMSGTGGTFVEPGDGYAYFEPTVPFDRPPLVKDWPEGSYQLVISGAAESGNNGTFPILSMANGAFYQNLAAVQYVNGSAVNDVDSGVSWAAQRLDQDDNVQTGYSRAFIERGYRIGHGLPNTILLILPYGSTAGTVESIDEMLRQKKAAGVLSYVERRLNP